jgi:hypothetical protein
LQPAARRRLPLALAEAARNTAGVLGIGLLLDVLFDLASLAVSG